MRTKTTFTILLAVGAVLLPSGVAQASPGQLRVMQDDGRAVYGSPATRSRTLDEFAALGADVVKAQVRWQEIAPGGRTRPSFDAADPSQYRWAAYDEFVRGVVARGMRPMLALGGRAPRWATGKVTRRYNGSYRPSAKEFQLFAQAAGTRYSGTYGGLPRVTLWSAWNEPNLINWLGPQRGKRRVALSPSIYRRLYVGFYNGMRASGHGGDTLLLGELMPLGGNAGGKIPPLQFLREMFCLNQHYRQYRGRAARARGCGRVGRVQTSGLAYHPYTARGGPRSRPRNRNDASIGQLSRVARTLDALARRGKLPRRLPVWNTEYGFQTDPPDPFQYSLKQVPGFLDESEWLSFRNSRVASYSQYQLVDDRLNSGGGLRRYAGFQQGLRFASGRAKRAVYQAFELPAFVRLRGGAGWVDVFGGRPGAAPGTPVKVESRLNGGRYTPLGGATLSPAGYFTKVYRLRHANKRVFRITIAGLSRVKHPVRR